VQASRIYNRKKGGKKDKGAGAACLRLEEIPSQTQPDCT